jgi:hypothetical protein
MARTIRPKPSDLAPGWSKSGNPIGEVGRLLALNLQVAIGQRSVRDVARATDVDDMAIHAILGGQSWPDAFTLAKLENGLGVDLWPGRAI